MKLWNVLSVAALGTLFVVGCSSTTTTTTDGGVSDTGGVKDTGSPADTGTAADTSGTTDTGGTMTCEDCQKTQCASEAAACSADADKLKGCNDLISCINACSDTACANACISASTSAEGKAFIGCVSDKCATACGG